MANEDGVWRTVGGRRIFIKNGQSLSDAMKASGKFKSRKDIEHQKKKLANDVERGMFTSEREREEKWKEYDAYDKLSKMSDQELKDELYDNDRMLNEMDRRLSGRYNLTDEQREKLEDRASKYEAKRDEIKSELESRKNGKGEKEEGIMSKEEYEKYASKIPNRDGYAATSYQDYLDAIDNSGPDSIKRINDELKYIAGEGKNTNNKSSQQKYKEESEEKIREAREKLAKSYNDDELKKEIEEYKKTGNDPQRQKELEKELESRVQKEKSGYTDKQLEMVWENEDSTEVYNHLTKAEKTKMRLAERDAYDGNESARQYVEKMNDEAAKRFLDAHKNDSDYEGYFMKDKDVANENKKMDINDQKYNIEKSSGLKVEKAYETDAYGTGKEDRFKLEDGRYVAHNLEDDTWSVNKVEGGKINGKDFKSYDDMLDHLKGGSNDKVMSRNEYDKLMRDSGMYEKHRGENISYDDYVQATKDVGVEEVNKSIRDEIDYEKEKHSGNQAYKKAFEDYKKKHPNSKITLNQFINMSEGK